MAKLVPAKCPSCGATIVTDPDLDAAVCEYCGNAFIVAKAVNNYNAINVRNTTNTYVTNNVTNNVNNHQADNRYSFKTAKEYYKTQRDSEIMKSTNDTAKHIVPWLVIMVIALLMFASCHGI